MTKNIQTLVIAFFISVFFATSSEAAITKVKGKLPAGKRAVIINGGVLSAASVTSAEQVVKLKIRKKTARLYIVNGTSGVFEGPVVLAYKKGKRIFSYAQVVEKQLCNNTKTKAILAVKRPTGAAGRRFIKLGTLVERDGFFTASKKIRKSKLAVKNSSTVDANCLPLANAKNLGFGLSNVSSTATGSAEDPDSDGLVNKFDVDDDNDGIMDQYDPQTPDDANRFWMFSNLKVDITDTVNANTGSTPTDASINKLVSSNATLAIEVTGDASAGETTELDCSGLSYCSAGGTGKTGDPLAVFPGVPGGVFDSDSDGLGTITKGATGDFQLFPGAKSTDIGSGDTLIQVIRTAAGKEKQRLGMLNSIFNTVPAVKKLSFDTGGTPTEYNISYPVKNNGPGTSRNCFSFPDSGEVSVTFEAWRPQRRGISGAGEASFMDIGHSIVTVDIPNEPCTGNAGCTGNGPGMCPGSAYSTSDTNLSTHSEGLLDSFTDTAASSSNFFTFTLDLKACLDSAGLILDSGEKVFIDLQLRNSIGDNAAQKFCVERE